MTDRHHPQLRKSAQLRTQVTLFVLVGVFLSCFLVAVLAGANTRRALVEQAERDTSATLRQVIKNLTYYLDDMESLASLSNVRSSVIKLLVNDASIATNQSLYYESAKAVREVLIDLSNLRPEITSIMIAGENGALADTTLNLFLKSQVDPQHLEWYQAALGSGGKSVFLPPHLETDAMGRVSSVISLTRPIDISRGAPPLGAICINLSTDTLKSICEQASLGLGSYLFILDDHGNIIYHPSPNAQSAEEEEIIRRVRAGEQSFHLSDLLALSERIESAGYRVCAVVPYSMIVESANRAWSLQMILGAFAAVLMAMLIAWLLARQVFRPLYALQTLMGQVRQGDFSVRAEDSAPNEIGMLAHGFNEMIEDNNALMQQNIRIEKAKRKAEISALQAQITPHFLYNTLDSIVWMADYKPAVAARMADALAKLFRLMLGGGADVVPLRQELEHVEQYLTIQSMRYSSKLEYEIVMEPGLDIENILLPKLLLQPLVENAIYHGIKPADKKCLLRVRAMLDGGDLVLLVLDDGVGMSEETIQKLLTDDSPSEKVLGGIGVKNIDERIHMYCAGNFGLSFLSAPGVGSAVTVRLPAEGVPHPSPD